MKTRRSGVEPGVKRKAPIRRASKVRIPPLACFHLLLTGSPTQYRRRLRRMRRNVIATAAAVAAKWQSQLPCVQALAAATALRKGSLLWIPHPSPSTVPLC